MWKQSEIKYIDSIDFQDMVSVEERRVGDKSVFVGKVTIDGIEHTHIFPHPITTSLLEESEENREWIVDFVLNEKSYGIYKGLKDKVNAASGIEIEEER